MRRRAPGVALAALAALAVAAPAQAANQPLNAYRVKATPKTLEQLAMKGYDVGEGRRGNKVEIYGTASQIRELRAGGIAAKAVGKQRKVARRASALAPPVGDDSAWDVWTRFDSVLADGKVQYTEQYDALEGEDIVKKVSLGKTLNDRDIWALKVTKDAKTTPDNSRPAVLYNAIQHAREWLAGETCRRTLDFFVDNYGGTGDALDHDGDPIPDVPAEAVTELVDSRELWFVCITNPDGYEFTFTPGNRLWRKNMRDNNNDGQYMLGDGVDPNRNFASNWGLDEEGSSANPASETYRGPGPDSEAETQAMKQLWNMVDFKFQKNDHTAAELLLWPQGFQQYTKTPDNAIFEALAGDDVDAAIADKTFDPASETWEITGNRFDPDLSSELYITNGDTLDDGYRTHGILGYTPEGSEPADPNVSGFEFEDSEDAIEDEFRRHLLFSIDLAQSAGDPGNPSSHMGNGVSDFYVDTFKQSWGDPQAVQATVKRSLGPVVMRYRINDGATQTVPAADWQGGERYGKEPGVYYHRVRGVVTGTKPGDEVRVWFAAGTGDARSAAFNYRAASDSGKPVLIMADENYTGPTPDQDPSDPKYLGYYTDALNKSNIGYDIYDVDKQDTTSPDWLGVLSHYKAVIWYTGDDYVTRRPGQPGGTGTARFNLDEEIDVRDYLNEGGKLFFTGKNAGRQWAEGYEVRNYGFPEPPEGGEWCSGIKPEFDPDDPTAADGCIARVNDFLQYYLGAYVYVQGGQSTNPATHALYDMAGSGPLAGLGWKFDATGAGNQDNSATFPVTSTILDPARYPTFASSRSIGSWLRPGAAPFDPFTGSRYAAAGADDASYKRLHQTVDLTGSTSGSLTFKTSYDLEQDYDYMFVEVVELDAGGNPIDSTWTTVPDVNGHTSDDTGLSCPTASPNSNWHDDHPFLTHYQTITSATTCDPTGTSGVWNGATGSSGGWVDWHADLTPWAGSRIEVYITVASDPGTTGLGVWIDDAKVTGGTTPNETSFEDGLGAWTAGPPPPGTDSLENGWQSSGRSFSEGGVVATDDTVYTGFGFEGMDAAARPEFMKRVLAHLGVTGAPGGSPGGNPGTKPGTRARARIRSGRRLRADRKRRVKVRIACIGDAGARCQGKVRIRKGTKRYGSKSFSIRAGKTATVKVKLTKKVFRKLMRTKRGLKATLSLRGTDTSGAKISANKTVRLLRPKRR